MGNKAKLRKVNQEHTDAKSFILATISGFGFLIFGYGLSEMNTGNDLAPILATIGAFAIAIALISFDSFRKYLTDTRIFRNKKWRIGLYFINCIICILGTYFPVKSCSEPLLVKGQLRE